MTNAQKSLERLFWRAGFGPSPAERAGFGNQTLGAATDSLLRPSGPALAGKSLRWKTESGALAAIDSAALTNRDNWSVEVLWWLDRMVRTRQPLIERMTLNLHDHFATSMDKVDDRGLMIAQNQTLRAHALGNFRDLVHAMYNDRAMQWWLDLVGSDKTAPNENFARELMELFTIGLNYSQDDVLNMARCFTGITYDWDAKQYGFDPTLFDDGPKTIFGHTGNFGATDAIDLCLNHPAHAPYLVAKIWGYFVPTPPSAATTAVLTRTYKESGFELRPLVRAILSHRAMYTNLDQPDMVKPPVVYLVGALRALGTPYLDDSLRWVLDELGQQPFHPPNVAGWDQNSAFLSTQTLRARWQTMGSLLDIRGPVEKRVPRSEPPLSSVVSALKRVGNPPLSRTAVTRINSYARGITQAGFSTHTVVERRRGVAQLIMAGPDAQMH